MDQKTNTVLLNLSTYNEMRDKLRDANAPEVVVCPRPGSAPGEKAYRFRIEDVEKFAGEQIANELEALRMFRAQAMRQKAPEPVEKTKDIGPFIFGFFSGALVAVGLIYWWIS